MQPGTFHWVLTTGPTLVYGQHFYTFLHLKRSVSCAVHALYTEYYTTNTGHIAFFYVLLRFLAYWVLALIHREVPPDGRHIYDAPDLDNRLTRFIQKTSRI